MKSREPRRKVMLTARMRLGGSWDNARILDISSRGLLLESPDAPQRGSYVEVRRGQHIIVARVMWVDSGRFGLLTQDRLSIDRIVAEPDRSTAPRSGAPDAAQVERRSVARPTKGHAQRFDASRRASRTFQFIAVGAFGASAAFAGYETVRRSLACPMSQVSAALAHQAPGCVAP